jgi:RNA polymerase sigma-70 factor (ECF subfamily)
VIAKPFVPHDPTLGAARGAATPLDFAAVYARWFHEVERWVRALGGLAGDSEDLTQEVFLVVRRKLAGFDGVNLAGWLYRIAELTVRDHRRRAWWRRVLLGRNASTLRPIEAARDEGPGVELERKQDRARLELLLGRMSEARRTAFILFEIEGYEGEEIARLQGVAVNTVWTRLHHARREFLALLTESNGLSADEGRRRALSALGPLASVPARGQGRT